ncbi:MAG: hypothetical protein KJ971_07325 [Firmicutes bacterium]|nr:hypothetical protein [Bacillota bacterium]
MIESKFQLISYILMIPIFIFTLLLIKWDYEIDGILVMGILIVANGCLSMIKSSKHSELGRVFWLKKDYKLFRFIEYDKGEYGKLPVIYLLFSINFLLSLILTEFTFAFKSWNMIPAIIIIASWIGLTVVFSIIEVAIDKIRQ